MSSRPALPPGSNFRRLARPLVKTGPLDLQGTADTLLQVGMRATISKVVLQAMAISVFLVIFACVVNGQKSTAISKAQVQAVLDSIDKALVKKDAAAVVANYASNAVITATIVERGHTDTTKHSRDDYKQTLESGFKVFDDYSLQRKELTIEIAPDGKTAQCRSTVVEKYRFDGRMKEAVSKESVSLAVLDGKLLVTKDHSDTSIK